MIREALRRAGSDLTDVTFDHVEAVRSLLDDGKSGKVDSASRRRLQRRANSIDWCFRATDASGRGIRL